MNTRLLQNLFHKAGILFGLMFGLLLWLSVPAFCQQDTLPCNTPTSWIPETYSVSETHWEEGQSFWQNGGHVPENVVNESEDDYARAHIKQTGSATLRVSDNDTSLVYEAGNYIGFYAESPSFLDGEFEAVTVSTYLNGILQESYTGPDLLAQHSQGVNDPIHIGFVTSMTFNEIEIRFDTAQGMTHFDVFYAVIERYCTGELPGCNIPTTLNRPAFPATIDYVLTGSDSASVGYLINPEGAISFTMSDYASLVHHNDVTGNIYLAIKEQMTDYAIGTFMGFDVQNTGITGITLMDQITIETYLGGVLQESHTGSSLMMGASMHNGGNRHTIGFVTTAVADEVRLVIHQDLSLDLGTTRVYGATFQLVCAGPDLACNDFTRMINPDYPVLIDGDHTGISGAVCVACDVQNPGYVIDDDTTNFARIVMTAGVLSSGSLAVVDVMNEYPAGSFAGYHIENASLVGANVFTGVTISTYLDGVLQESESGAGSLVIIGSDLLQNTGEHIMGFITQSPFDEVKISLSNAGVFNIGSTRIYNLVIDSLCTQALGCDSTYWLVNPSFPAVIDASLTGTGGVLCVACSVEDEMNVVNADPHDYATITITAGVAATGSIAVIDGLNTYPFGTIAGFAVQAVNSQVEADLLNSLTISTYLNGVFQESASGNNLLDVAVYLGWVPDNPDVYNLGLKVTLPFDEVRITAGSIAGVNNIIRVYAAFVDTRASIGEGLECNDAPVAVDDFAETDEEIPVTIDVLANDSDEDGRLTEPVIADPPSFGHVEANMDSTITYTPDSNFVGTDEFTYQLCDDVTTTLCDTANVTVVVHPVTDTIVLTIPEDTSVDKCADELTTFTTPAASLTVCSPPVNGTINISGTCFEYTPDPDFSGHDTTCVVACNPTGVCDTTVVIIIIECTRLELKVLLEGPYDSVTTFMSTDLNEYHVLPGQDPDMSSNIGAQLFGIAAPAGQPYDTTPWNWMGREGDNYGDEPGDIPYDEEVTDWILVSVRAIDSLPSSEVWKCAGLLYNDGQVFFPEDCACASAVQNDVPYYIIIEHRNHLPVMSEQVTMTDNVLSHDFTQNQSWIYEIGGMPIGRGQKQIGDNYVMYSANSEQVSSRVDINASDDARWLMENSTIFQYKAADHNMDGDVNATDEFVWLVNNSSFTLIPF